jgi:Bifunctional DNA primase/polymerase, N-terminal
VGVLEQALELASQGKPVFPCSGNKSPAIPKEIGGHGFRDATCDEAEIRRLFKLAPRAKLVGVPCGQISGFDVLDIDPRHGGDIWEMENAHRLPPTRVHISQSGGRHYLFRHTEGVRNSANKKTLAPGVDVRGEGGYVVHPPSFGYHVAADVEMAEWPDWLLGLVLQHLHEQEPQRPPSQSFSPIPEKRLNGFVQSLVKRVREAPEGGKHYALRNAALSLGGIQQAAALSDDHASSILTEALPSTVKDWKNAKETIAWGLKFGKLKPIELPDRPRANGYAHSHGTNGSISLPPPHPPRQQTPPPSEDARRPTIRVFPGLRHTAADQSLDAMTLARVEFFQRDRSLVRAATTKAKTADGKIIEIGAILPVTNPMLAREMGKAAEWERVLKTGEIMRIDPPREVVDQVAAMAGEWPFPPITGIIATPTMRPDGSLLTRQGYDEATGLVLISPPAMPVIPQSPTRLDADRALELLQSLLTEFPFADEPSRSVALSMILTPVLRGALLPAVPMHVATAPQPGSGKSFLGDIASAVSTGERCPVIAVAPNPEETEKRLVGAALSGQQIISIDNVSEMLSGNFLNQVTERPILQLRPLGTSDMVRIANSFTVFANGNNLSAPADLVRRTLLARLDANLENPEDREFTADPVRDVMASRGTYVAACLTIGRAYVVAGNPSPCRPLPSFERWSNLVRSALVWLGCADPCASMEMARAEDPIRAARAAIFKAWELELKINPSGFTAPQLIEECEVRDESGFFHPLFREACLAVAAERSGVTVSSRRLGKWLASANNNRVGDLKLTANRQDPSRVRWVLARG